MLHGSAELRIAPGFAAVRDVQVDRRWPPLPAEPRSAPPADGRRRRSQSPLPPWRLKRVIEHIETNLGTAITLAALAGSARLSRMHFAAQFKTATGSSPHEFVQRRRIKRARRLLADPDAKLVDVALSVGFQTQAHFTTVFKRHVGETPHRWRRTLEAGAIRAAA